MSMWKAIAVGFAAGVGMGVVLLIAGFAGLLF